MSENKHTPEPWRTAERSGFPFHIDDARGESVAMMLADDDHDEQRGLDNANRIVACINACAGIDTLILRAAAACGGFGRDRMVEAITKQRDELLAALEDAMIMIWRIKKHCQITDNAGYTLDGRMLKLTDVEQSSSAAIANTRKAMGKCYYAPDGTLMNSDGTRSIFDDVDQ